MVRGLRLMAGGATSALVPACAPLSANSQFSVLGEKAAASYQADNLASRFPHLKIEICILPMAQLLFLC